MADVEMATERPIQLQAAATGSVEVIAPSVPATTAGVIGRASTAAAKRSAVPSCLAAAVMETWSEEECFSFVAVAAATAAALSAAGHQIGWNC